MTGLLVPASRFEIDSWVKNSHFISTIGPAFSVAEAKDFISELNQRYADATHNVPAYLIGSGSATIAHASDNGEPSGTAGRPALSVLMGSGLGDTVLVITRYFGGTKLGTGGLVKAYSSAAKDAVEGVPKARKIAALQASLTCPYAIHQSLLRSIKIHQGMHIQEDFSDQVRLTFLLPADRFAPLQSAVNEISNGQITVTTLKEDLVTLQPIKSSQDPSSHA